MGRLRNMIALLGLVVGLVFPLAGARAAGAHDTSLPPGWKRVTWEAVIISYPAAYTFSAGRPDDSRARAQATLREQPGFCDGMADCSPVAGTFRLYPGEGLDVRSWV